jgi:hypothetical protein
VKAKQTPRISPHDWLTTREASSLLSYLTFLCCQLPFCEFSKHTTALHYRYDNANVLHFCSFCKPTFSGATREWDALYISAKKMPQVQYKYFSTSSSTYAAVLNCFSLETKSIVIL